MMNNTAQNPQSWILTGKVILVTGGTSGIGESIARQVSSAGAHVVILGRNETSGTRIAEACLSDGGKATFLRCDVSKPEDIERAVQESVRRWGRLDGLVNSAGICEEIPFLDITLEDWHRTLSIDLSGPFLMTQEAARVMVEQGRGSIVNIASISGHIGETRFTSYCTAKHGLIGMTKVAAIELAAQGVRVNTVSPGYTNTPMVTNDLEDDLVQGTSDGGFQRVPIKRLLRPDEVAAACIFLLSDAASGITGTDLLVDGGLVANGYVIETLEASRTAI